MFRGTMRRAPSPPVLTRIEADSQLIRRAMAVRSRQVREEVPSAELDEELQEQEPRGILRVISEGIQVAVEFFESAFSADQSRFLEEYVQAARESGTISLYYPALGFPEDYVIRKVKAVAERAKAAGVQGELTVRGYLYDSDGQPRDVA